MKPEVYIVESARTTADDHYPGRVCKDAYEAVIGDTVIELQQLDELKKSLFYNRDNGLDWTDEPVEIDDSEVDRVHGVLGIATEAGELLELIWKNRLQDKAKLMDECGDILWYVAMLCRSLDVSFEDLMDRNIEKLRVRFPQKFTTERANIRDEVAEQEVFKF